MRKNANRKILLFAMAAAVLILAVTYAKIKDYISISNNVNGRELPIYSVETEEKKIALSFDAAWGNEDTQKILDILKKEDVRVSFFMTGGWVESYPDDVKAIEKAGHDLGNHSENHKDMTQIEKEEKIHELSEVHNRVKELTGDEMTLFRAPYGAYDDELITTAGELGYATVQWDVDSLDWKDYGKESIIRTILDHKNLRNGSIILCHNGSKYTADALPEVIRGLKEKGYAIVPISELIYRENYHMDVTGRQIRD